MVLARRKSNDTVLGILSGTETTKRRRPSTTAGHRFSFLYSLLNPRSKQWQAVWFKRVIAVVIVLDLVSFILSTEPSLRDSHKFVFDFIEGISSTVFLIEYLSRVATCTERQKYSQLGPLWGRLRFMLSASSLIDALASLPFFLEPFMGVELPRLTYLRFLRLLRITKTNGAMKATDAVYRVVYYNREILFVCSFVCLLCVLGTGLLLYYLRPMHPDNHLQDAENFESISQTMYLATLLLTGQGGPEGDLPWYTKAVVLLTSIVSVAMFSIPASMLTWGFEAEAARMAQRSYTRSRRRAEGMDSSDDDYSTDEEYMKIIAEVDEGDSSLGDEDDAWQRELLERFQKADADFSGNLTLKEFIELSSSMQPGKSKGEGNPVVLANIVGRIKNLEGEVRENTKKLNRILELLEESKKHK